MIKVKVDDRVLQKKLKKLRDKSGDLSPAFNEIGEQLLSSIEKNFEEEGRYSSEDSWRGGGKRWDGLADATIEQRKKINKWPGKILQVSGRLAASITKFVSRNVLEIGTNLIYAALQHFGGKAGRGKKVTVPARPFLVVQDEDIEDAVEVIERYLTKEV